MFISQAVYGTGPWCLLSMPPFRPSLVCPPHGKIYGYLPIYPVNNGYIIFTHYHIAQNITQTMDDNFNDLHFNTLFCKLLNIPSFIYSGYIIHCSSYNFELQRSHPYFYLTTVLVSVVSKTCGKVGAISPVKQKRLLITLIKPKRTVNENMHSVILLLSI